MGLNFLGSGADYDYAHYINAAISGIGAALYDAGEEDCLFLDLYVPGKAIRDPVNSKLPVMNWIYGGAVSFPGPESWVDSF
jgi:carboxylesterase type B